MVGLVLGTVDKEVNRPQSLPLRGSKFREGRGTDPGRDTLQYSMATASQRSEKSCENTLLLVREGFREEVRFVLGCKGEPAF